MKNQIISKILKFAFAFMFILIASSCSEDNETLDASALAKDQINSELSAKGAKVSTLSVVSAMVFTEPACVGVPHPFTINNTQTGPSNGINIQYETSPGVWEQLYQEGQAANAPTNFTFTFTAAGTYNLRYKMDGSTGFVTVGSITVTNCGGCEESFSYVANGGGSYTFYYTPAESVIGANVIFTFAQGVNVDGLAGWNENGSTRQKVMDLVACTTYTWTVILTPNCSGHSGNSNVWTDFKVNNNDGDTTNDSKKNDNTPNIIMSCPN